MAYGAKDITVLKGLEPVRERPGMYIGSTGLSGLHHLVYEVVDNAVDEAMAGHATRIDVTLLADGACRVSDNGRGIPVDNHPDYKNKSAAEVVLTVLHAGGKFGGEGYKISGGLHGVGVSVVNALSEPPRSRDPSRGSQWEMSFENGGRPTGKLEKKARVEEDGHDRDLLARRHRLRGDRVPRPDAARASPGDGLPQQGTRDPVPRRARRPERPSRRSSSLAGITDFVRHLNASKEPIFKRVVAFEDASNDSEVDVAMQWNTGYHEGIHSFANNIATTEGGMHEEGFKKALTNAVNKYCRGKNLLKEKDDNLLGEDIREGLTAIISVKLRNPQFEGQTKTKLGNTPMRSMVEKATNEKLGEWLEEHPAEAKQVVAKATPPSGHGSRRARRATSPAESPCSSPRRCRASSRTARRRTPPTASCSSSRATAPAARPSGRAIPSTRRSCRSAARSSTSSARAWTRC